MDFLNINPSSYRENKSYYNKDYVEDFRKHKFLSVNADNFLKVKINKQVGRR